ncbi:transposase [Peptoniphilus asaccharolyticus]|nr:transposase [Peptoniphilus asaccharolyticus]
MGMAIDNILKDMSDVEVYIVMPNHVHFILEISNGGVSVPQFVRKLKSDVSRIAGKSVWQRSYYDRVIRDEKEHCNIYEYIENNAFTWDRDVYYV